MDESDALHTARALREALARLNRRLRAQHGSDGVGSTALSLLGRLVRNGASTAAELAAREGLQPQSVTRALQSLEERRLIARVVDATDRRRSLISIAPQGVALLRETARSRELWLARAITSSLTASERDMLTIAVALLERVADADADR